MKVYYIEHAILEKQCFCLIPTIQNRILIQKCKINEQKSTFKIALRASGNKDKIEY